MSHSHHHGCHHGCNHGHPSDSQPAKKGTGKRLAIAAALGLILAAAASLVQVRSGESLVITRFGDPVRVLLKPGLAWRLPAPFEIATPVDLRLRTTSSGLQDVGTRDGLRIIVQSYAIWQVDNTPEHVQRFMRAVQNQPDEAARQIRTYLGSALETTASGFTLSQLVNTDSKQVQLSQFEAHLKAQISQSLLESYGIRLVQTGTERLTLPAVTLNATVDRMRAERETIATERTADGKRAAAEIRSAAERDARIVEAQASVQAANIEAQSQVQAADIYAKAYASSPQLYVLLRQLDALSGMVNSHTRLVLRTDAAPFSLLVDGPKLGNQHE
ncbi:protease modulator HflC [Enterobacteriaceae bacterium RIT714]|uniref:protease modulator HflC n=1 Tax=Lelliottia sp. CFBP8978 TaxID=3096522 RepID=UPI0012ACD2CD|nr:protease modulator HflC [Lelliottia sp. CFBP8978]MDY1038837.1 protease modulator HflC [Lelliottia sp. CFBP8978]MRS92266.1 protease modulator HflC [Enterobacteriaceae bacterium RIT714]